MPSLKTTSEETEKKGAAKKKAASFSVKKKSLAAKPLKTFDEILRSSTARVKIKKNIARELLKMKKEAGEFKTYVSPYSYIYADYLKTGKFEKMTSAIENRLTDLGIGGRIHRLSQFKNLEEIIEEDVRRGVTTVVIVGDDKMVEAAIGAAADLNVVLGIIPMGGGEDRLAELLGIPEGAAACDVLSQRILETLDVGKINGKMFFSKLSIFGQKMPLVCDRQYEIYSPGGDIVIYNLNLDPKDKDAAGINPKDGRLEVLVKPKAGFGFLKKNGAPSLLFAKELRMKSDAPFSVFVDGRKNFYKDIDVEIVPKGLKVVVGKNRQI